VSPFFETFKVGNILGIIGIVVWLLFELVSRCRTAIGVISLFVDWFISGGVSAVYFSLEMIRLKVQ
jgi:hypothetical protein